MYQSYPDVVSVVQLAEMLNIGKSSAYSLLKSKQIRHLKIGCKYIIPKQSVIDFVRGSCYNDSG